MTRLLRPLRWIAALAGTALVLWLAGFAWFIVSSLSPSVDRAAHTDAIVVLTGGRARLETGFDLFGKGKARMLFISGVNQEVHRAALMRLYGTLADPARCCTVLGHDADDTFGNARETAEWMARERFVSLRLVTSWYHMPRALLEFRRAMPGIAIVATPVFARRVAGQGRMAAWFDAAALTLGEYDKLIASWLRPAVAPLWPRMPGIKPADRPETTAAAAASGPP